MSTGTDVLEQIAWAQAQLSGLEHQLMLVRRELGSIDLASEGSRDLRQRESALVAERDNKKQELESLRRVAGSALSAPPVTGTPADARPTPNSSSATTGAGPASSVSGRGTGSSFCPNCGSSILVGANFCMGCGGASGRLASTGTESGAHAVNAPARVIMYQPAQPLPAAVQAKQIMAFVSAAVMAVGVFCPAASYIFLGDRNFFEFAPISALLLLVLAVIAVVTASQRKYRRMSATGQIAAVLVVFLFVLNYYLAHSSDIVVVSFSWGWAVMLLGAVGIIGAGYMESNEI